MFDVGDLLYEIFCIDDWKCKGVLYISFYIFNVGFLLDYGKDRMIMDIVWDSSLFLEFCVDLLVRIGEMGMLLVIFLEVKCVLVVFF